MNKDIAFKKWQERFFLLSIPRQIEIVNRFVSLNYGEMIYEMTAENFNNYFKTPFDVLKNYFGSDTAKWFITGGEGIYAYGLEDLEDLREEFNKHLKAIYEHKFHWEDIFDEDKGIILDGMVSKMCFNKMIEASLHETHPSIVLLYLNLVKIWRLKENMAKFCAIPTRLPKRLTKGRRGIIA